MTCEQCRLELDGMDNRNPPADMNRHLSNCPRCAQAFTAMQGAMSLYRLPLSLCSRDIAPRIAALLPFMQKPRRVMALRSWLAAGLFLMVSVAFIPFLEAFKMLKAVHGNGFLIPLGIVTGVAVSLYLIIFIATHVEDFSRRFGIRKHA